MTRRVVLGALLAAPAIHGARAQSPVTIRFGWSSMPAHLVPSIFKTPALQHHGRSYVVQTQNFSASTPMITAMAAGQIDLSVYAPTALALSVTNARTDLKVVADCIQDGREGYRSQTLYVKANSPIRTPEDLRGKRIGVNGIGSASYTSIVAMLRKHKIDEKKDLTFIEVSFANQLPMIEDDKIDATTIPMPMGDNLVEQGKYRVLFTAADALGPAQFTFLAARGAFLKEHGAAVSDMLEDYIRALRWSYDPANRTEALKIIAAESKRKPESLGFLLTKADYYRDKNLMPMVDSIQSTINLTHELGFLPKRIDVAPNHVDLSYLEAAIKRVGAAS
jgi:NitT/TauT family transport system substrate-binding protein